MSDPTARIEALEVSGYDLPLTKDFEQRHFIVNTTTQANVYDERHEIAAELLTNLEQADARLSESEADTAMWKELFLWAEGQADMQHAIGAARLGLAERRITNLEALNRVYDRALVSEQATTRMEYEECHRLSAALAAERAKRCATCEKHGRCTTRVMEWDMAEEGWFFRYPPSNFSCSKWQPREEAGE